MMAQGRKVVVILGHPPKGDASSPALLTIMVLLTGNSVCAICIAVSRSSSNHKILCYGDVLSGPQCHQENYHIRHRMPVWPAWCFVSTPAGPIFPARCRLDPVPATAHTRRVRFALGIYRDSVSTCEAKRRSNAAYRKQ